MELHQILLKDRHRPGLWRLERDLFETALEATCFAEQHFAGRSFKIVRIQCVESQVRVRECA